MNIRSVFLSLASLAVVVVTGCGNLSPSPGVAAFDAPAAPTAGSGKDRYEVAGSYFSATPLMQYRRPVGGGPSSNT